MERKAEALKTDAGEGASVAEIGGIRWHQSNSLNTFSNYASSGKTAYEAIAVGKDAIFAASLGKTKLGQKNFEVKVAKFPRGRNPLDPGGVIAASASFNFFFG